MKRAQDTLTLDPVALNVVNRVAAGSHLSGDLRFEGGLLVQGRVSGKLTVNGRLIIWRGGMVQGRISATDDVYLFGQLGEEGADAEASQLSCEGQVYVARTGMSTGTLLARRLVLYEGAELQGPFKTLRSRHDLPVLSDVVMASES
jgi:cytoskeletal protein CcmA (bactofilin family)